MSEPHFVVSGWDEVPLAGILRSFDRKGARRRFKRTARRRLIGKAMGLAHSHLLEHQWEGELSWEAQINSEIKARVGRVTVHAYISDVVRPIPLRRADRGGPRPPPMAQWSSWAESMQTRSPLPVCRATLLVQRTTGRRCRT